MSNKNMEIIKREGYSNFLLYTGNDGNVTVDVFLEDETVWLPQKRMGLLFGKSKATISEHFKNIFNEQELQEEVVVRNFRTTTQHGAITGKTQRQNVKYYNLDAIISVGYRVNSYQATQFRITIYLAEPIKVSNRLESGLESKTARKIIKVLSLQQLSRSDIAIALGNKIISGAINRSIKELLKKELIEYTIPGKPNSRLQKYRLRKGVIINQGGFINEI